MDARAALNQYLRAQETTRAMLEAARNGDWEGLVNLEIERRATLDSLFEIAVNFRDAGLQEEKDACIRDMLKLDDQIRALTEAWMAEMRETLASVQSQRKLTQAYGAA